MNYNLLDENWIPVLCKDGHTSRVGIRRALTDAATIRQIAAANPMDNVALLRLLLAVLQWCKPTLTYEERKTLHSAQGVADDWLTGKLGTGHEPNPAFDLLGGGARFFQDQIQAQETPNRYVSDLFAYFPAATEINHFRHVYDQTVALCAACCALGLTRLPTCAMQGGQGKSPSINNAPPIYFIPLGNTLLETLLLNWPFQDTADDDHPAWETGKQSTKKVGILEGFTWQPRKVWLGPLVQGAARRCARCGAVDPLISKLVFKKGRSRKTDPRAWRDPHVAWSAPKNASDEKDSDEKDNALRGPNPLKYSYREASLWRQTARAVLASPGKDPAPIPSVANAQARLSRGSHLLVACHEAFTKQAKAFDEHRDAWRIPSGFLRNNDVRGRAVEEIDRLDGLNLWTWISKAFDRKSKERPDVKSTVAFIGAGTEHRLRKCFEAFVEELSRVETEDEVERRVKGWRQNIHDIFREALDQACSVIAVGSSLRRREAAIRAKQALDQVMAKWAKADKKEPKPGGGGEPKGHGAERGVA